jgi:ribosomal subunit interface protein
MKVPPEITYRDVDKTEAIETLVQQKIAKLEQVCDHISSCHIVLEKINDRPRNSSPYRVRLDITVPPGHEIVAENTASGKHQYLEIDSLIRDAFETAWRQLRELSRQQREFARAKTNDGAQDTTALVTKLFPEQGYGFLKTLGGEDVYFHRNSVVHGDFGRLEVGTGVRFEATDGDQGLQATTVHIVDKPGARVGKSDEALIEPPLGWQ